MEARRQEHEIDRTATLEILNTLTKCCIVLLSPGMYLSPYHFFRCRHIRCNDRMWQCLSKTNLSHSDNVHNVHRRNESQGGQLSFDSLW